MMDEIEMTDADILRKAKAHISDPEMWFKGGLFEESASHNKNRRRLEIPSDQPCCGYAAVVWAVGGSYSIPHASIFLHEAVEGDPRARCGFGSFNDHRRTTHADVMDAFDRAIELAEQSQ